MLYFNGRSLSATAGTVCQYEAGFHVDVNGSAAWVYKISNISIEDCMARCEAEGCREILYDNTSLTCQVADLRQTLSLQMGRLVYYNRVCSKVEGGWTFAVLDVDEVYRCTAKHEYPSVDVRQFVIDQKSVQQSAVDLVYKSAIDQPWIVLIQFGPTADWSYPFSFLFGFHNLID